MTKRFVEQSGFTCGVDLGSVRDFTAICVLDRIETYDMDSAGYKGPRVISFEVRHLQRFRLGQSYPVMVEGIKRLIASLPRRDCRPQLVVDATGVGRAVIDLMREAGMDPIAVTITSGFSESATGTPKKNLIGALQVALQTGRLKIAEGLPDAPALIDELLNFRVKISAAGNETSGSATESIHDDLLISTALAIWAAARRPPRATIGSYGR